MKKWVDLEFDVGDVVYLKTDEDQKPRIVAEICIKKTGIVYNLCQGTVTSWHYDFEMSVNIDVKIKTSDR